MTVRQFVLFGDSLPAGGADGLSMVSQGGVGSWAELIAERLSNIPGIGPLVSAGFRGIWNGIFPYGSVEWAQTGSWTITASTDAYDKAPHGLAWSASGATNIATYTVPAQWRSLVGFAIYWIDYAAGGNWSYRVNGGTWTAMGQALQNDNRLCKFYVPTAVTAGQTIEIRAANAAGSAVGCLPVGIEPFFLAPSTANGFIVHNLGAGSKSLHAAVLATSGDRLAWFDSVRLGTGSPISNTPTAGVVALFINDVSIASTATYDTDLALLNTRIAPLCRLGLMNPWGVNTTTYDSTQQTAYRAHLKTSAASFSPAAPVLDFFDAWNSNGWGSTNTAQSTQGITDGRLISDGVHEARAGHNDIADRAYWWVRANFFTIGKAGSIFSVGSSPLGSATALLGGQVEIILPDSTTVAATPGASTVKATNTLAATGKAVAVTAGAPTIHATRTISPSGVAVGATAGVPTLRPGALTLAPTGKAVAATAGAPTLRAANTIAASGKAVTVTPGTAFLTARNTLLPSGKAVAATAGSPTIHAAYTLHPSGKAVAVTPGASAPTSPNTILASAGYSQAVAVGVPTLVAGAVRLLPSGKAVAATAGAPALHATNVIAATGKAVAVTPGSPTTHSTATLHPSGKVVTTTPGSPALRGANTIVVTGKVVTTTAGAPTVRSTRTLFPTGKAITIVAGAATVAPGVARLHPSGVAVAVTPGVPAVVGGQGEPSTVTVTVVPTMRATVAVLPHATATVSV